LQNSHSGRILAALADRVNVAIIDELFAVVGATPRALASSVHRRLGVSRPTISNHLTQLEERLIVQRNLDGTVSLTDPDALALILQGARRLARAALTQAANEEAADHYLAQRRINRTRSQFAFRPADLVQAPHTVGASAKSGRTIIGSAEPAPHGSSERAGVESTTDVAHDESENLMALIRSPNPNFDEYTPTGLDLDEWGRDQAPSF